MNAAPAAVPPAEDRYARHRVLPGFGAAGQAALGRARALIVGLGGLGVPAASYLAAAGIGRLELNDFDTVDATNLQRQPLYRTVDVGRRKAAVAAEALGALNPAVECVAHDARLDAAALAAAAARADVVLDCSDNFGTRFAINAACVAARTPLVSAAAIRWEGQLAVFDARDAASPCYACLYGEGDEALEDCRSNGVLGPVTGVIGTLAAVEAVKLCAGLAADSVGRLLRYDARSGAFHAAQVPRDPACPVCGTRR